MTTSFKPTLAAVLTTVALFAAQGGTAWAQTRAEAPAKAPGIATAGQQALDGGVTHEDSWESPQRRKNACDVAAGSSNETPGTPITADHAINTKGTGGNNGRTAAPAAPCASAPQAQGAKDKPKQYTGHVTLMK